MFLSTEQFSRNLNFESNDFSDITTTIIDYNVIIVMLCKICEGFYVLITTSNI